MRRDVLFFPCDREVLETVPAQRLNDCEPERGEDESCLLDNYCCGEWKDAGSKV